MWGLSSWNVKTYTGWGARVISRVSRPCYPQSATVSFFEFLELCPCRNVDAGKLARRLGIRTNDYGSRDASKCFF